MAIADTAKVIIDRLLARLTPEERDGRAPAGFRADADDQAAIDDGEYGDPARASTRPDWMREQEAGWQSFTR